MIYRICVAILLVSIAGCSKTNDDVMGAQPSAAPQVIRISPADGAVDVAIASSVCATFDRSMDTASVRRHMHLAGGTPMHEWMDSLSRLGSMSGHMGGMGGHSGQGYMDDMMAWMETIDVPGHFHWNGALDSCEFVPAAPLQRGMEYAVVICDSVMAQSGHFMDLSNSPYSVLTSRFACEP